MGNIDLSFIREVLSMIADTATIISFITLITMKLIANVNPAHFVNLVLYAFTKDYLSKGKNMTRHL